MTTTPEELLRQARDALAPCPHCGLLHTLKTTTAQEIAEDGEDDPEPWMHADSWAVICDSSRPNGPGGCGASGGFCPTEAEAVAAWNRRAAIDAMPRGGPSATRVCRVIAKGGTYTLGLYENPSRDQLLAWEHDGDTVQWLATIGSATTAPAPMPSERDCSTCEHAAASEMRDPCCACIDDWQADGLRRLVEVTAQVCATAWGVKLAAADEEQK